MARSTVGTTALHNTDAEFRVWGKSICDQLVACGIGVAGDTGQINWATVLRPVVSNTAGGYVIYYLNDSLHATKPIYIKLEFGSGSTTTHPMMWVTMSSGTNGAGTLNGTSFFARTQLRTDANPAAGTFNSFFCVLPGHMFFATCRGAVGPTNKMFWFVLERICDGNGDITTDGFHWYFSADAVGTAQRNTYITSSKLDGRNCALVPGSITATGIPGGSQLFRHYASSLNNYIRVVPNMLTYLDVEFGSETIVTMTPVGALAREYLCLGGTGGPTVDCGAGGSGNNLRFAVRYE